MGERGSAERGERTREEGGRMGKQEAYFIFFGFFFFGFVLFFCIHLRVAIGETLHTHGENLAHTHTHTYGGGQDTVSALSESLRPCCRQRSGFYFRHEC